MITDDLIFIDRTEENYISFLENISDELETLGYVNNDFKNAIIEREKVFATGIGTEKFNLAIPHTDSEYVLKPGIAFVKFKNACDFNEMCTNKNLKVSMAFILLVKNKDEQTKLLSKLMGLFVDNDFLQSLFEETNVSKLLNKINNKLD